MQGFHLLCDWSDGFGGLASCIAEDLRDEYGNKGILTFLSSPLDTPLDKVSIATIGGVFPVILLPGSYQSFIHW